MTSGGIDGGVVLRGSLNGGFVVVCPRLCKGFDEDAWLTTKVWWWLEILDW